MGIIIACTGKPKIKCRFSCATYHDIRVAIAEEYNYTLGVIYKNLANVDESVIYEARRQFQHLYAMANTQTRTLMRFLGAPDDKAVKIDKNTCKLLLRFKRIFFENDIPKKPEYEEFWNVVENGTKRGIHWC